MQGEDDLLVWDSSLSLECIALPGTFLQLEYKLFLIDGLNSVGKFEAHILKVKFNNILLVLVG